MRTLTLTRTTGDTITLTTVNDTTIRVTHLANGEPVKTKLEHYSNESGRDGGFDELIRVFEFSGYRYLAIA